MPLLSAENLILLYTVCLNLRSELAVTFFVEQNERVVPTEITNRHPETFSASNILFYILYHTRYRPIGSLWAARFPLTTQFSNQKSFTIFNFNKNIQIGCFINHRAIKELRSPDKTSANQVRLSSFDTWNGFNSIPNRVHVAIWLNNKCNHITLESQNATDHFRSIFFIVSQNNQLDEKFY